MDFDRPRIAGNGRNLCCSPEPLFRMSSRSRIVPANGVDRRRTQEVHAFADVPLFQANLHKSSAGPLARFCSRKPAGTALSLSRAFAPRMTVMKEETMSTAAVSRRELL